MAGWVGTFWDLKHVGVTPDLDAILAQDREGNLFRARHAARHPIDPFGLDTGVEEVAPFAPRRGSLHVVAGGATR